MRLSPNIGIRGARSLLGPFKFVLILFLSPYNR